MKKIIGLFLASAFFIESNSQITKKNWLFGGSINFSSIKASSNLGSNTTSTVQVVGSAGYFVIDKLVTGLRPDFYISIYKSISGGHQTATVSSLGPFLRYYLLPAEQRTNIFMEGHYAIGTEKISNQKGYLFNIFSVAAGPEIFLNSSVGIELLIGYTINKGNNAANTQANIFQVGIGFQFHLEKE